jgi:hypothetical protein
MRDTLPVDMRARGLRAVRPGLPYLDPAHSVAYSTTQIASSACQYMAQSTTPVLSAGV